MDKTVKTLEIKAIEVRKSIMEIIEYGQSGHTGSDMSCTDILTTLYFQVMNNIDPNTPDNPDRDRYIQSKGHAAEALWAVLAEKGFFPKEELKTFYSFGSRLIGHPNNKVEGIEMNTGSLGHGLSLSVGIALAAKKDNKSYHTYTLMGDGELAEGSVWEGAMAAAHYKLDNLTAVIDRNGLQITGKSEEVMGVDPLKEKFEAFGWQVIEIDDGNSIEQLLTSFNTAHEKGKPKMIIAHTTKGKGLSFAENQINWHHKVATEEEFTGAMKSFDNQLEVLNNEI
ncbi:transketolase [Marinilactibacillus psychrotolerans]|uniref:transketolase n=1 Tax=Marinilactibacillus psychrotolerans TaxID=191770 RepID=UPI0039B11D25